MAGIGMKELFFSVALAMYGLMGSKNSVIWRDVTFISWQTGTNCL